MKYRKKPVVIEAMQFTDGWRFCTIWERTTVMVRDKKLRAGKSE